MPLNESTMPGLKKVYLAEVGYTRRARDGLTVNKLSPVKCGSLYYLETEFIKK